MSQVSRRAAMLAFPATASLVAAGSTNASASASDARTILTFIARRTQFTLPPVPPAGIPLGTTFVGSLHLLDDGGAKIGDGSMLGSIVDIIPGIPPLIVTQEHAIFRFPPAGEIHTSSMHTRLIPNPGVRHFIAITGGTGDYRMARGSGTVEHISDADSAVVLNVMVDPAPAGHGT